MASRLHQNVRLARVRASKLARLATRPALWPAVRAGVVPSVEHLDVPFRSNPRTVLDVGASRGQFASFALHAFPGARLICFEPLPSSRAVLTKVTNGHAQIVPVAVGSASGRSQIHVSGHDDSSSMLPIGERQVAEFPGTAEASVLDVEVVTLQSVLDEGVERPCLLKIDVQGLELEVLKGAGTALGQVDEILVECSFVEMYEGQALADEVVELLFSNGFRLRGIYGLVTGSDHSSLQADLLFRRQDA